VKCAFQRTRALVACLIVSATLGCSRHAAPKVSATWDRKAAVSYLDYRENWWEGWTGSARDRDTFCVSCHTALPYALARPAIRAMSGDRSLSGDEQKLIDNVTKRVRMWKEIGPYYSDVRYVGKTNESRGTESVLNALILANYDAQRGQLSDDTRAAFENMWAMQRTTGDQVGSWPWLQFDQEPWEAKNSVFYGASLAALAVGVAPENYASSLAIQPNLKLLREYLNRERSSESTLNRTFLLWSSTKLPGLITSEQQKAIIHDILSRQQSDGGWRLATIAWDWNHWSLRSLMQMWLRADGTPMEGKSDGVATGLATYVLVEAGVPKDNAQLQRGLAWLRSNQAAEGFWPASSVNKKRNPSSDTGRFMSDAATAFAVLALTDHEAKVTAIASETSGSKGVVR